MSENKQPEKEPFDAWWEKPAPTAHPDPLRALYDAAAQGFHVSETCGPERQYHYVSKFRNMSDLQAYHSAWTAAMIAARDSEAKA